MVISYTDRWNDFQFRSPVYLDGHIEKNKYDLVKWRKSGNKEYCYSVGTLIRDKDGDFYFESVGLRYLKDYKEGLNQWILSFCQDLEKNFLCEDEESITAF